MKSITRYALIALSLLAMAKPVKAMEENSGSALLKSLGISLVVTTLYYCISQRIIYLDNEVKNTQFDAARGNTFATLEVIHSDPEKCFNGSQMWHNYLVKQEIADLGYQLLQIALHDQGEKLLSIIKHAPFNPKNTNQAESLNRIKTFLLVLNRKKKEDACFNLPKDIKHKILSYLPEDILNEQHFRTVSTQGDYKTLVEVCPHEWFLNLADNLWGEHKDDFIVTITPYIVDYRLHNLKNLFVQCYRDQTPQEVALQHGYNTLADLLDSEKVEQHRDMLTKHICNELNRGRTSISSDNLPKKFKGKQQEQAIKKQSDKTATDIKSYLKKSFQSDQMQCFETKQQKSRIEKHM